jgi:hypothetical protein
MRKTNWTTATGSLITWILAFEDGRCVWDRVNRFALSVRLATDIEAEAWRASRNVILAENRILHDVNDRRLEPDEFWILYLIPAKEGDPNLVANSQAMAIYEHVMGLDVACITPSDFWDQIDSFHRDWTIQWIGTSLRLLKNLAEEHGRRYPPEGERPIRLVKG